MIFTETKDGRVTAGNSSQINDGAVAVVVGGEKHFGLGKPMAGWSLASANVEPDIMGIDPQPPYPR